jgi:hypothetical protein
MPPWSDLVVLLGIFVSTGWWMLHLHRRGLRGGRYAAASAVAFLGLALVLTMTAHCIDVLSRLAVGTGYDGAAFVYNFRTYSLMLLGAILIACGARLVRVSLLIGASGTEARVQAIRAVLMVLALVAPLIPIQGVFAIPLCVVAGVAMLLVLWHVRPTARPAEAAPAAVAPIAG